MQSQHIDVSAIEIGERLREIDADYVDLIAESFESKGQFSPIHVSEAEGDGYRLIAGAHRLSAAKALGWSQIEAIIFDGDELEAELLQIDENLIRRELTELDRGTFLARRKAIYEELHPQTKHGMGRAAKLATCFRPERFTKASAKKLGVSERVVTRAIARHKTLAPDVRKAIGSLRVAEKGTELDALAAYPFDRQRAIAEQLVSPEKPARSVREAAIRLGFIKLDREATEGGQVGQLAARYFALTPEQQVSFLCAIGAKAQVAA